MTDEQLQAIEARLKAATPGPWTVIESMIDGWFIEEIEGAMAFENYGDANFIAHAPEDIKALLDEVERLREENAELRQELEKRRKPKFDISQPTVYTAKPSDGTIEFEVCNG